uniref:Uncharacterized protein LOC114338279 n=1 Tax=Diabrotica virgifera virgifera TaxID=50390 RepID=A0A6P7GE82_DIAVI
MNDEPKRALNYVSWNKRRRKRPALKWREEIRGKIPTNEEEWANRKRKKIRSGVRDIRKEENTKVYTELKPLPLIDGTKDGSQNDTDVNNECHKEKSVDVIDVCQHNKDDTVDDDSDLDPSYDPQESEEISYETKKKRRIAKFFQTENEKSVVGTVMENEGLVDKQLKDINQETLPEAQISDKTDEGYEKNRKKEQEQRKSKLRGI